MECEWNSVESISETPLSNYDTDANVTNVLQGSIGQHTSALKGIVMTDDIDTA